MAYKKDQFHYLSTLCNPIIVKHRYYFQQNVINIISSSPSFLFHSQKPPASQVRRFPTSVFVSCTPAQNQMPAPPSLGFVCGLQKKTQRTSSLSLNSRGRGDRTPVNGFGDRRTTAVLFPYFVNRRIE